MVTQDIEQCRLHHALIACEDRFFHQSRESRQCLYFRYCCRPVMTLTPAGVPYQPNDKTRPRTTLGRVHDPEAVMVAALLPLSSRRFVGGRPNERSEKLRNGGCWTGRVDGKRKRRSAAGRYSSLEGGANRCFALSSF